MSRHSAGGKTRHWLRWTLLAVLGLGIVLLVDLAWTGSRAADAFSSARDDLSAGGAALQAGNVQEARNDFGAASSDGTAAVNALGHPAVTLIGWLPWVSDNVDAARRAARAIELAAGGGTSYAKAAEAAGWDGTTIPGFQSGGHFDPGALAAAAPDLQSAADQLGAAKDEMAPVDPNSLAGPLQGPIAQAKAEIDTRAGQADIAAKLAELVPGLLGSNGPRTYLLVTLSPSDPRGAGGYPGVYGVLRANGHQIRLSDLKPTASIPQVSGVNGPKDAKRAWHWAGIDQAFWDTTYTPDFPTAATFMKGIWQAGGGPPVDGVIAGDPALMAALIGVIGPVTTPAWPEAIDAQNLKGIVGADVYRTKRNNQSNQWEVGIGSALWDAVLTRPWPPQEMATAIAGAAGGGHLRVWTTDPEEEQELHALGISGAFQEPTATSPVVTLNGFTNNRAGYFASTQTAVSYGHDDQGRPTTTATATIHNGAPTGPPSILLGLTKSDAGGQIGAFGTDVNIYIPQGSVVENVTQNGRKQIPFEWNELGAHAVSLSPLIPPGGAVEISVTYRSSG